jgi:isovaleryl-CoA dehydrogenase
MERHVRNTIVTTIYGGTSEIQKEIISRSLGL